MHAIGPAKLGMDIAPRGQCEIRRRVVNFTLGDELALDNRRYKGELFIT
jgi:hypothetical protein